VNKKRIISVAALLMLVMVFSIPAYVSAQQPALPHYFYGTLKINNVDAPQGTTVEANLL
jgi:hypothetical protein